MKIALCFSGMLRTFDTCLPTILHRIVHGNPEHEFNSFIATWDVVGRNPVWWEVSKDNSPINYDNLKKYSQALKLKHLLVESYEGSDFMAGIDQKIKTYLNDQSGIQSNPYNLMPMFYKIEQSFGLMHSYAMTNTLNYDLVVRIRTDLNFHADVKIEPVEPGVIVMPKLENWGLGDYLINDQFAYGVPATMRTLCTVHSNMVDLFRKCGTIHPETMVSYRLKEANIKLDKKEILYHIER